MTAQITKSENNATDPDSFLGASNIRSIASIGLILTKANEEDSRRWKKAKLKIIKGRRNEYGMVYGHYKPNNPDFISEVWSPNPIQDREF